jgi:hypothetical protein
MESRPEFSESLHQRILTAVEQKKTSEPKRSSLWHPGKRRWLIAASAWAAACAMLLGMIHMHNANRASQANIALNEAMAFDWSSLASSETSGDSSSNFDDLIALRDITSPSRSLQQDLHTAAVALAERLPVDVEWIAGP